MPCSAYLRGVAVLGASALALLTSACCKPDSILVRTSVENGQCVMEIDFEEAAFGVYVTAPGAKDVIPTSQAEFSHLTYWGIDTTTYPPAIYPPVRYGSFDLEGAEDSKIAVLKSNETGTADDPFWTAVGQPATTTASYPLPIQPDGVGPSLEDLGAFEVHIVTMNGNGHLLVGELDEFGKVIAGKGFKCGQTYGELPLHYGWEQ